ncbi:MAG: hypothetical protein JXB42_02670, partial [Deltaproteobacteria bacterium]|nr:hypothetical protein [Deltaproteobacteria bacterium]
HFGRVLITLFMGVTSLGATVIGYFGARSFIIERILTGMAAILLIYPEPNSDIAGVVIFLGVYIVQKIRIKKKAVRLA